MRLTDFKLLCQIGGKSINDCDFFFDIVIFVMGGHCNYSLRPPENGTVLALLYLIFDYFTTLCQVRLSSSG